MRRTWPTTKRYGVLSGTYSTSRKRLRGDAYANAMRNSGAARILLPYRVHRAGYADAVEAAQAAVGTPGNPVVGIDIRRQPPIDRDGLRRRHSTAEELTRCLLMACRHRTGTRGIFPDLRGQ